MSKIPSSKTATKSKIGSKIPTSGRDSGTHSRSSSVSNLTISSDIHSEIGDVAPDCTEGFKIDDRVFVNGSKAGCIKFIGKTQFAPGIWAGILLDESIGKNDGSVGGVKYFVCEPMRGIFARLGKLSRTIREGSASSIRNLSIVGTVTPKSSSIIPSSRASTCSTSSISPKTPKLRIGDRISVSSLSGLKTGTLKYIGETDFAKGEWAGIQLDEPSGKNDGSVAGKRYFSCEMKYGLFAPLHKVYRPRKTTPISFRGTPLVRSNSKDSLCSSISTCSRASRVKLGVTSLSASAQHSSIYKMTSKQKSTQAKNINQRRILNKKERQRLIKRLGDLGLKKKFLKAAAKCGSTKSSKPTLRFHHEIVYEAVIEEVKKYGRKEYGNAQLRSSQYPPRHLCAVCGFMSKYSCMQCHNEFCCVKCFFMHKHKMSEVFSLNNNFVSINIIKQNSCLTKTLCYNGMISSLK